MRSGNGDVINDTNRLICKKIKILKLIFQLFLEFKCRSLKCCLTVLGLMALKKAVKQHFGPIMLHSNLDKHFAPPHRACAILCLYYDIYILLFMLTGVIY